MDYGAYVMETAYVCSSLQSHFRAASPTMLIESIPMSHKRDHELANIHQPAE